MLNQHPLINWHGEIFTNLHKQDKPKYQSLCARELLSLIKMQSSKSPEVTSMGLKLSTLIFYKSFFFLGQFVELIRSEKDISFVILRRENTFKRIYSSQKAARTGTYHLKVNNVSDKANDPGKYAFDFNNLVDWDTATQCVDSNLTQFIEECRLKEISYFNYLRDNLMVELELLYEDDIQVSPKKAYGKIINCLNLAPEDAAIDLKKTSQKKIANEIANYSSIKELLGDSEFSWMLRDD